EEIGVAEGDVLGAGGDLLSDIFEHDFGLHDAEQTAVDGHDWAVAAEVFASARGLGVADASRAFGDNELAVARERGEAAAVGDEELLTIERDEWEAGREVAGEVAESGLEFAADDGGDAGVAEGALVEWCVESVGGEVCVRVDVADARDEAE